MICVESCGRFHLKLMKLKLQQSSLAWATHSSEKPQGVWEEAAPQSAGMWGAAAAGGSPLGPGNHLGVTSTVSTPSHLSLRN